jgi:hypothetical protein
MEYKIKKTNPEGTKTRWSAQRVSKSNQPIGKAEIFSTEEAAKRFVASKTEVKESYMSSIMKGILSESGEKVSVVYIDGKAGVKYTNIDDARAALKLMKDKHPKKNIEIKSERREMASKKKVGEYSCYAEVTDPDEDDELMSVLVRYDVDTDRYDPEGHDRQEEMITNVSVYDDSGQEDLSRWILPPREDIDPRIINAICDDMEERAQNSYQDEGDEDDKHWYRDVDEAANAAQQAAIAVDMKKQGKKPKDVDEARQEQGQRRYKVKPAGQIDEASMSDVIGPLIREFNLEHGGSERWSHILPLHTVSSSKRWRRGDGSYYTDPNSIEAFDQSNPEQRQLQSEFYDWLIQKPGVKRGGEISGEFRSSDYSEAAKYKGVIFVKRGYATEYFTPNRLRNSSVWNKKNDNDQEKEPKQQKTIWEPLSDIQGESSIMKGLTS